MRIWVVDEVGDFAAGLARNVQVHADSLVILARLQGDENLALGTSVVDEFGRQVPLADGSVALVRSEWISGTPNVFGLDFTVDLGVDRAINRIRLLAGETALRQREYFIRGYRLETSTQRAPRVWKLLAEEPSNFRLNVDTRQDSTWSEFDAQGAPVPGLGRFVRLTLIRQDRSNWVALGEIEVFGLGYASEGSIEGAFVPATPVNVGRIRWRSEQPERTGVEFKVRGTLNDGSAPLWEDVGAYTEAEVLFAGEEPVERIEYRAGLHNDAPYATPSLLSIEVEYDPVLVAQVLLGEVTGPDTIRKGVPTRLEYRVRADVGPGDYGIDLLRLRGAALEVEELRIDGRSLEYDPTLSLGFRSVALPEQEETVIELAPAEQIVASATLEIVGQALFLRDRTAIVVEVGSRQQSQTDGFVNWQQGREEPTGSWTVLASGAPLRLLSQVEVNPRPFSPFAGDRLIFDVVVSNIEAGREIALEIFALDGRRLRRLVQTGRARAYRFEWDGRDGRGGITAPGLYLYEVGVSESGVARRGTFVVAY